MDGEVIFRFIFQSGRGLIPAVQQRGMIAGGVKNTVAFEKTKLREFACFGGESDIGEFSDNRQGIGLFSEKQQRGVQRFARAPSPV